MFYFSLLIHGTPYKKHGPARLSAVTARLAGQRGSKTDLIDLMSSNSRRFRARKSGDARPLSMGEISGSTANFAVSS